MSPSIELDLDAAQFLSRWANCSDTANLLGQALSQSEEDSQRFSSLASTILNEMLEAVHNPNIRSGRITVLVERRKGSLSIRLTIPADPKQIADLRDTVASCSHSVREAYLQALVNPDEAPGRVGLLELAAVYGVVLRLRESGAVAFIEAEVPMDVSLSGTGQP